MRQLEPIQVAHRGFDRELTVNWIHRRIKSAIDDGVLDRPVHTLPPKNETIPMNFSESLIETWRFQYDKGHRVEVPRQVWDEIDDLLGVGEQAS